MANVRLLRSAEADLDAIAEYTVICFGNEQANVYRDGLLQCFEALARNPDIGSDQSHIKPNLRRYVHRFHSVYYRTANQEVVVMRILGPGQDPLNHLLDQ